MNTKPSSASDQDLDPAFDDVYDDTDLGAETWDDGAEDLKPRKKKGGLFNVIVIVLGVVAFGGIMLMRVASTPVPQQTAEPQQPEPAQQATSTPGTDITAQPTPDATSTPGGTDPLTPMPDFAATPDAAAPEGTSTPDIAGATNAPADTAVPDIDPTLATNVSENAVTPTLTPPPVVSMTPNDAAQTPVIPAPAANVTPTPDEQPTVPTTPVSTSSMTGTPIDQGRLQEIEDKLNTLATQLGEQKTEAGPSDSSQAALSDVQTKLDALIARLDALEAKVAAAPKATEPATTTQIDTAPVESVPDQNTSIDLGHTDQMTSEPVADVVPAPVAEAAPKVSRPKYVLRAVSRDKAYIASSKSAAVQGVAVGDTVPGWGTVRSITQGSNGRWSVVTDNGTIRQ